MPELHINAHSLIGRINALSGKKQNYEAIHIISPSYIRQSYKVMAELHMGASSGIGQDQAGL